MLDRARELAEIIKSSDKINVVSHIDADGLTAGSIASKALTREGIEHEVTFVKQLDERTIESLKGQGHSLIWFTDLGSGMTHCLNGLNVVITDHHVLSQLDPLSHPASDAYRPSSDITVEDRTDILRFSEALEQKGRRCAPSEPSEPSSSILQLNPHLFGRDGATDVSGAGVTYLVAKAMDPANIDLAGLAVVGAVGDLQAANHRRLIGTNRDILSDAQSVGVIDSKLDINYFGRETRPVHVLLKYANDPLIPTLTKKEENCIAFLRDLGIELKSEERWRRWIDLTHEEKRTIISGIVELLLSKGFDHKAAKRVLGEVYILPQEAEGTELHDAKEFATLLNSCGRYDRAIVGYNICLGDREEWLGRAKKLLQGHRRTLVEMLKVVKDIGVVAQGPIQYFIGGNRVRDNVVGIVAGMMLGSGEVDSDKPLFGFADAEDGSGIKVSARANRALIDKGLDLSKVMSEAAEQIGGVGGGHNIAAGALIPYEKEREFLELAEKIVGEQLGVR